MLAAAGITIPESQFVDGVNLLPVLLGTAIAVPERPLFWHYPHWGNQGGSPGGAIRDGHWKLIEFYGRNRPADL